MEFTVSEQLKINCHRIHIRNSHKASAPGGIHFVDCGQSSVETLSILCIVNHLEAFCKVQIPCSPVRSLLAPARERALRKKSLNCCHDNSQDRVDQKGHECCITHDRVPEHD